VTSKADTAEADTAEHWLAIGRRLAAEGRGAEADAAFERAFAQAPELRLIAEAVEKLAAGSIEDAARLCTEALALAPVNMDALRVRATILTQTGRPAEAERIARDLVRRAPGHAGAWTVFGTALSELDRGADAIAAMEQAATLRPDEAEPLVALGSTASTHGDFLRAERAFRAALAIAPDYAPALMGLGHALKTLGQRDDAVAAYRACLDHAPDAGEVWWSLANLKVFQFTDADIARMEAMLAAGGLADVALAGIAFALGKANEDRGDYDRAFHFYAEGNDRQRQRVRYDPGQTQAINERLVRIFDRDFFAERAGWGSPAPDPIFILGLPRAGSTLIEQILASHPQVDGTSELPTIGRLTAEIGRFRSDDVTYPEALCDLDRPDCAALGEAYLARSRHHRGTRPFFTDKMPNNFASIGFIHLILPNARIIDARRHPMDTCMGAFKQLFARGQTFTYDLFELGDYYLEYDRLMAWWDQALPGRVLRVDHEALVMNQEAETRRLLEYCGLPWDEVCLRFHETRRAVNTASSEQVRRPLYRDALGGWRRYARHLTDLEAQLQPVLREG
jgi:tetratricopeptide (TPR) repeat protein